LPIDFHTVAFVEIPSIGVLPVIDVAAVVRAPGVAGTNGSRSRLDAFLVQT